MEHQKYIEWIQLSFLNELSGKEKEELEMHLKTCSKCKSEYEKQKKLFSFLSEENTGNVQPDAQLLNEARRELKAALRVQSNRTNFGKNFFEGLKSFFAMQYKIALSGAVVLLAGFFIGYLVFNQPAKSDVSTLVEPSNQKLANDVSLSENNIQITNVRFISKNPANGEIEFTFDAVKPMKMKGNINDQKIQSILTYSILNSDNPGVRLNSINAMSETKSTSLDNDVKETLIRVVKFDENPGVRREAIKLLNKFPYDDEIKHAYLYVLSNDTTSGMRIEAINNLYQAKQQGYQFTDQDLSIFKRRIETDQNNYIRYRAKTVLQENK